MIWRRNSTSEYHWSENHLSETTRFSVTSSSLGRFSKSTSRLAGERERIDYCRNTQTLPRNLHTANGQSARLQTTSRHRYRKMDGGNTDSYRTPNETGQHSSMINISIKNTVTPSKTFTYNTLQTPVKPIRTYRSSLSRSKSFNVEADKNGVNVFTREPYISNLQLNRLNETPPLKSPGILASISRSNKDLLKDSKY